MNRMFFLSVIILISSCKMNGQQIVYDLPEKVTEKARDYLDQYKGTDSKFIAKLSKQGDEKYILFIIHYDFAGLENFKLIEEGLVKKTSRVIRVNELLLPLLTDEDFLFADFGSEKMKDGRVAKKKVIFNSEGYPIYFDKRGKLYEP
jgi:hypothetical protein